VREAGSEPAARFYRRLAADFGAEVDLEATIREHRTPHTGLDL